MNKKLFFLFLFSFLTISNQLECSSFLDDTCEGHNTKYNLGCHKFRGYTQCREVEIDDGCKIDEQDNCVKTDTNSKSYDCYFSNLDRTRCKRINIDTGCKVDITSYSPVCSRDTNNIQDTEDCFLSDDYKTCAKKTKACNLYSVENCGGLKKITGNSQCILLYNENKCKEIELDEDCNVNENTKLCEARSGKTLDVKYHCKMNDKQTQCKKQLKECKDFDINNCGQHGNTCKKVEYLNYYKCQIVTTIHDKCTIDDDGVCKDKPGKTLESYEKCDYNSDYTECKPRNRECFEMDLDKCSDCRASSNCKKVEGISTCLNVKIDNNCEIKNEKCQKVLTDNSKSQCLFNSTKTGCIYHKVEGDCKLTVTSYSLSCENDGLTDTEKQICAFEDPIEKTTCKPRQKICSDYNGYSTSCEAVTSSNKKCSYTNNYYCKEYTIDNYCTVDKGECKAKEGAQLGEKNDCIFNSERDSCTRKEKKCENYFEECNSHKTDSSSTTTQCTNIEGSDYCKTITIDKDCQVDLYLECNPKSSIDNKKICAFDKEINPTSCTIRDRKCSEIGEQTTCNSVENCFFYNGCHNKLTDNNCEIQNGNCKKKNDAKINEDNEKCDFVPYGNKETGETIYKCEKINKACSEYTDQTKCNNAPNVNNYKCHYLSSRCKNVTLDGNCIVDTNNKCVENGSGKLSSSEICQLYEDRNYGAECKKREKICSDFDDNTCGNYSPRMKLCFKLDGDNHCTEVKVDDQCTFDGDDGCKGDHCKFDEDNNRCYYEKNYESWLKLNQIILLMIFFMF